jgi:hypothetical protein
MPLTVDCFALGLEGVAGCLIVGCVVKREDGDGVEGRRRAEREKKTETSVHVIFS